MNNIRLQLFYLHRLCLGSLGCQRLDPTSCHQPSAWPDCFPTGPRRGCLTRSSGLRRRKTDGDLTEIYTEIERERDIYIYYIEYLSCVSTIFLDSKLHCINCLDVTSGVHISVSFVLSNIQNIGATGKAAGRPLDSNSPMKWRWKWSDIEIQWMSR